MEFQCQVAQVVVVPHWYQVGLDSQELVTRQHSLVAVVIWLLNLTDLAEMVKFGVVHHPVVPVMKMTPA